MRGHFIVTRGPKQFREKNLPMGLLSRFSSDSEPTWGKVLAGLGSLAAGGAIYWLLSRHLGWHRPKRVRVASLYVYPIKGCKGHSLSKARLTKWGIEDDRTYMIVNDKMEFVSQRELTRMALIHPDLPTSKGIMMRVAPGEAADPLLVPLKVDGPEKKVRVWEDWVPAIDQGDEVAKWLSSYLRIDGLRLVRIAKTAQRTTDPKYGIGETAFSDGFPVLVTSQASIDAIRRRVKNAGGPVVGIDRFRPNIHVEGCGPFQEDEMRSLSLPGVQLPLVKPCSRCTVPGIDQQTGTRTTQTGGAVTKTLREHRSGRLMAQSAALHKGFFSESRRADDVYFGQNALVVLDHSGVEISVGDIAAVAW